MDLNKIRICDGVNKMNFLKVTQLLSQATWSKGIKIEEIKQGAINSALVVGIFYDDYQIGYARVISDKTRFAYIADVYVDEDYRHQGIAKQIMTYILSHESLKDVYQWLLISTANELYKEMGFAPVAEPESWMEIRNKRPER